MKQDCLLGFVSLLLAPPAALRAAETARPPNIIIMNTDDQADLFALYWH